MNFLSPNLIIEKSRSRWWSRYQRKCTGRSHPCCDTSSQRPAWPTGTRLRAGRWTTWKNEPRQTGIPQWSQNYRTAPFHRPDFNCQVDNFPRKFILLWGAVRIRCGRRERFSRATDTGYLFCWQGVSNRPGAGPADKSEGNRLRRWFQLGKRGCFSIVPVHEIGGVVGLPETSFFSLALEIWNFLFHEIYLTAIMGNHNLLINNPFNAPHELEERNLLFMDEGGDAYLPKLFKRILTN